MHYNMAVVSDRSMEPQGSTLDQLTDGH